MIEQVSDALRSTAPEVKHYADSFPEFREVGKRMLEFWDQGLAGIQPDLRASVPSSGLRESTGLSDPKRRRRKRNPSGRGRRVCSQSAVSEKGGELSMQTFYFPSRETPETHLRHEPCKVSNSRSEEDWFDYRLENDPRFLKRIEQARASLRAGLAIAAMTNAALDRAAIRA